MTSTQTEEPLILKTDVLGRVRMPADRREAILDGFEQSGMSGQAFAKQIGVKYSTFASWIQKRRRQRGDYAEKKLFDWTPSEITFVEAHVDMPAAQNSEEVALEVHTCDGMKLLIHSQNEVSLAAQLLHSLGKAKGC